MKEIVIDKINSGQKIEKFVKKFLSEAPLGFIYKAFRKKDIKVNGHWVNKDHIVFEGDVVRIYVTDEQLADFLKPREVEKADFPYPIIYESDNVLIVDKPSGVLTIGDNKETRNTLARKVLDYLYFKGEFDPNNHIFVPSPAHRLDRNTAGLVVFGKTDAALKELEEVFKLRTEIEKRYLALVDGIPEKSGTIKAPLKKNSASGLVSVTPVSMGGKEATTVYHLKETFTSVSLVECELLTGRTHQIRVHLAYIDHPIIGDGKYGNFQTNREFKTRYGFDHQFLHAATLSFKKMKGPLKELENKTFTSPLDKDEAALLNRLHKGE
ncbi:MAG: RluA family pseudouridine synthase [Bacilli bacterium]|nr:RluA family pseudouridine synthase [Bacilli bacterium]